MKAYYDQKRNQSIQWLWACVAAMDFLIWGAYGIGPTKGDTLFLPALLLALPLLIPSALVHYVFACERYLRCKGYKNSSRSAVLALVFSLLASLFCIFFAFVYDSGLIAYFGVPAVFALGALPFKLMQDRA